MLDSPPRAASPEEYEATMNAIYDSMLLSERNGDYVEAENLQRRALRYKKQWEEDTLAEMADRFELAMIVLQKAYNQDLEQCNNKWTNTLDSYLATCKENIENSDRLNMQEIQQLRVTLNEELPSKVKESYQLMNLREMEHHMSKQKDFVQAHLIQNKIRDLYAQELATWNQEKAKTIEQAVFNLRTKHKKQRDLSNKRSQIQLEDYNNAWQQQKTSLLQRFNNNSKQLKAAHERQVGSFKRQFKNKGGVFSSKYDAQSA